MEEPLRDDTFHDDDDEQQLQPNELELLDAVRRDNFFVFEDHFYHKACGGKERRRCVLLALRCAAQHGAKQTIEIIAGRLRSYVKRSELDEAVLIALAYKNAYVARRIEWWLESNIYPAFMSELEPQKP